jgi:hypothetical protein
MPNLGFRSMIQKTEMEPQSGQVLTRQAED